MKFENYEEIKEHYYNQHKEFTDDDYKYYHQYSPWSKNYQFPSFGQIILFQRISDNKQYYPQIALFIDVLPCDMAHEFHYVYRNRTWMNNNFYERTISSDSMTYETHYWEHGYAVNSLISWGSSNILIFGVWDKLPGWKEIRRSYEKTAWWGLKKDIVRDRLIDSLIK